MNPLPAGWKRAALRHLGRITNGATPSASESEFWGGDIPWATPEDLGRLQGRDLETTSRLITEAGYRSCGTSLVPPGSIFLSTRAPIGHLAIARQSMCFNQGCRAITLKSDHLPEFFFYYMSAIREDLASYGQGSTFRELSRDKLAAVRVRIPPRDQQVLIAEFLDRETARIDALIAKQKHMLGLLDEHRRARLSQVLLNGLHNERSVISTSSTAVPQLPVGWRLARGRDVLWRIEQGWSPQCDAREADDHEWGVLKVGCVNGDRFDAAENKALPSDLAPIEALEVREGDLLMSRANTRELVGSASLVGRVRPRLLLCDKLYRLCLRSNWIKPRYAELVLTSDLTRKALEAAATGASPSMKNISQEAVRDLVLPLPPLAEQEQIADHLDAYRARHATLRARATEMIERLREHRASLITAAVTGGVTAAAPLADRGPASARAA